MLSLFLHPVKLIAPTIINAIEITNFFDMDNVLAIEKSGFSTDESIDIRNLPVGTYWVKIETKTTTFRGKFVKANLSR